MKRLYFLFMIIICFVFVAFASVQAGTIYEQLPGPDSTWAPSSSTLNADGDASPNFIVADDFELSTNETITDLHWWGFSFSGSNDFQFKFYEAADHSPGNLMLTTGGSLSIESTGTTFNEHDILMYSSILDTPFNAQENTRYWFSIFNLAEDANWAWLSTDNNFIFFDGALQREIGTDNWDEMFFDVSFRLTNDAVPEPATMFLLGTGLVGVAGVARRKKNRA